jgi:hypothetical protein
MYPCDSYKRCLMIKYYIIAGIAVCVTFCLLGGCASVGKATRVSMVQPSLTEDLKWIEMFRDYGFDLAPSRDARAGALKGMTIVEFENLPAPIRKSIEAIIALGNAESNEYMNGYDAGIRMNLYFQATQGGVMGIINLLNKFGGIKL